MRKWALAHVIISWLLRRLGITPGSGSRPGWLKQPRLVGDVAAALFSPPRPISPRPRNVKAKRPRDFHAYATLVSGAGRRFRPLAGRFTVNARLCPGRRGARHRPGGFRQRHDPASARHPARQADERRRPPAEIQHHAEYEF